MSPPEYQQTSHPVYERAFYEQSASIDSSLLSSVGSSAPPSGLLQGAIVGAANVGQAFWALPRAIGLTDLLGIEGTLQQKDAWLASQQNQIFLRDSWSGTIAEGAANVSEEAAYFAAGEGLLKGAATASSKVVNWFARGAENDAAWGALSRTNKFFYEIGQKHLANFDDYAKYGQSVSGIVARGRAIVKDQGYLGAILPTKGGLRLGLGDIFHTGPTPLFRWLLPKATDAATAGGFLGWQWSNTNVDNNQE